jgi:hypothetical protein
VDLFTMSSTFLAKDTIDEFTSAIWVERYAEPGEVQLSVKATPENIAMLSEGTFLGLRGSKEVMLLETQSVEGNTLKVAGKSLLDFLDERPAWFHNPAYNSSVEGSQRIIDFTADTFKPGEFIAHVVDKMVINPDTYEGGNLQWPSEVIDGLELGAIDSSGVAVRLTAPVGPLLSSIKPLADQFHLGLSLYLDSADASNGFVLKFKVYQGLDRTTAQTVNPLVRLVPAPDSLTGVKELHSIADYKNVCYVWYKNELSVHYADPDAPGPEGFARRVLVTDAEGSPPGHKIQAQQNNPGSTGTYTTTIVDAADIAAFRAQNAKDALANHNYIRAVDGQSSPESEYSYGVDFLMGDVIELQGLSGIISKARITEFIRSQDATGEKAYPTISVIT